MCRRYVRLFLLGLLSPREASRLPLNNFFYFMLNYFCCNESNNSINTIQFTNFNYEKQDFILRYCPFYVWQR